MTSSIQDKKFPEGMEPLGKKTFKFACHPGVPCYMLCCRNVDMLLYPYDIIRLKKTMGIRSDEFIDRYVRITKGSNPFFPALAMKMTAENCCPFLGDQGCTVYEDRPAACRTYPLERAVDRTPQKGRPQEFYFLTRHEYCKGHGEDQEWTVKEWLRDQNLMYYNAMADSWAEMDTIFAKNPWAGEGTAGPRQRMAFMVCYNIDGFRDYVDQHEMLDQFKVPGSRKRLIAKDDEALLNFGYDWLKFFLANLPTLQPKHQVRPR